MKTKRKISWFIFASLSISIGLYPLIYFLIDRKFGLLRHKSPELLADVIWNIGFYTHIILGGIALLTGWSQFSKKLRLKNLSLHKRLGKVYVFSVLLSAIAGIYIGFFATGGIIAKVGFISLGIFWFYTTLRAFLFAKAKKIAEHQVMMIYSYAACFAAVTLRIWLPILTMFFGDFIPAYRMVAWLSWVPNIIIAFFIIQKIKKGNSFAN